MGLEQKALNLCSPGKILRTKANLRFFKGVDTQSRDCRTYIIKSSEIAPDIDRVCIILNDDWVLKFRLDDFDSKWGREPGINKWIEILGN